MRITHAPVAAGRNLKRFSERARERLQRSVVGIEGDVGDRHSSMRQLIGGSFEQQPPSHGSRSFFDHGSEYPVKLGAALIRLTRQIVRLRRSIQRIRHDRRESACRVLTIPFIHGPSWEGIIAKNEASRLIVRTNFRGYGFRCHYYDGRCEGMGNAPRKNGERALISRISFQYLPKLQQFFDQRREHGCCGDNVFRILVPFLIRAGNVPRILHERRCDYFSMIKTGPPFVLSCVSGR